MSIHIGQYVIGVKSLIIGAVALCAVLLLISCYGKYRKNSLKRKASKQIPIEAEEFLKAWDKFRVIDRAGCYIITIYNKKPKRKKVLTCKGWDEIYIGQSINIYRRVRNHFTGHGNGDVYADVKYGKSVYVRFVLCNKSQLNAVEKRLIEDYKATKSYNVTAGGSKSR